MHEESDHPIRLYFDRDRHINWSTYLNEASGHRQSFVEDVAGTNETYVIDSAVLQNHVRSLLIFDAARASILELVDDLVSIRGRRMIELWIQAHDGYPYTRNLGLDGHKALLAFWEEFDAIADQIFDRISLSKIRIEVTSERRQLATEQIREFVGISEANVVSPAEQLEEFAGVYVRDQEPANSMIEIVPEDGCLVARSDSPTIDVNDGPLGCFQRVRLVPETTNEFFVEAWPYRVRFEKTSDGKMILQLSSSDSAWKELSETYVRQ